MICLKLPNQNIPYYDTKTILEKIAVREHLYVNDIHDNFTLPVIYNIHSLMHSFIYSKSIGKMYTLCFLSVLGIQGKKIWPLLHRSLCNKA